MRSDSLVRYRVGLSDQSGILYTRVGGGQDQDCRAMLNGLQPYGGLHFDLVAGQSLRLAGDPVHRRNILTDRVGRLWFESHSLGLGVANICARTTIRKLSEHLSIIGNNN